VDLYRIHSEEEALAMGLDDYLYGQGVTAIEWAERVAALLPQHTTHIHIREGDRQEQRRIYMEGIETQS
jgi:tRNA threonylcarbamoyladenosine biosynthesis protein TsaE